MRSRLVMTAVAVTSMVVIAFSLPLALLIRDLAEDRAVTNAEREANALARTLVVVGPVSDATIDALIRGAGDELELAVIRQNGEILGEAEGITPGASAAFDGASLLVDEAGGVASYVPVAGLAQPTAVRSWVGPEHLRRNVAASWTVIGVLGLVLVLLAALLADRLGRSMVQPVEDLAAATSRLGDGDLDAAVEPAGPTELVAVGTAFNRLVSRMRRLIEQEREAVADLSHRLRTPLTALRLNAEALDDSRAVLDDVEHIERTVDAIIEEARRPIRQAVATTTDLSQVVAQRVAFWQPLAVDQARAIRSQVPEAAVMVAASPRDAATVVDALLENVFAHTPEGTGLAVTVAEPAELVVEDEGGGFDGEALMARGASGRGGTGLGLDIVRRTAEATGGHVTVTKAESGGARVAVRFGPPDVADGQFTEAR